jgi:hypothetical protein
MSIDTIWDSITGQDPESVYPPVSGGMVETARKKAAAEQGQLDSHNAAQAAAKPKFKRTVDVSLQGVPVSNGRTFVIGTNSWEQILPANERRVRATITAPDAAMVICFSLQQANDPVNQTAAAGIQSNGFVLTPTTGPYVTMTQGVVYAVNPSDSTAERVAVAWDAYPEGQ